MEIKTGDIILFTNDKDKDSTWLKLIFDVQKFFDRSQACHAEIVSDWLPQENIVITLGSDTDGLMYRERPITKLTCILRVNIKSPFDEQDIKDALDNFFTMRTTKYHAVYGKKNLVSGICNQFLDWLTLGHWSKRLGGFYSADLDCSATAARILQVLYPGFEIRRTGQNDLIDAGNCTPGDLYNAEMTTTIKEFGV